MRQDQEPNDSAAAADRCRRRSTVSGTQDRHRRPGLVSIRAAGSAGDHHGRWPPARWTGWGSRMGRTSSPCLRDRSTSTQRFTIGPVPAGVPLYLHVSPGRRLQPRRSPGSRTRPARRFRPRTLAPSLTLALADTQRRRVLGRRAADRRNVDRHVDGLSRPRSCRSTRSPATTRGPSASIRRASPWPPGASRHRAGDGRCPAGCLGRYPGPHHGPRASDSAGAQATTSADITPDRSSPLSLRYLAWSVPDALLGGLDVAATALGAAPCRAWTRTPRRYLYDGIEHTQGAFITTTGAQPVTLTTDLAGDFARPRRRHHHRPARPRRPDRSRRRATSRCRCRAMESPIQDVLTGQVSPLPLDQSFVLPAPVQARFARLRIEFTWADSGASVRDQRVEGHRAAWLQPVAHTLDVADPSLGGHVVWADPAFRRRTMPNACSTRTHRPRRPSSRRAERRRPGSWGSRTIAPQSSRSSIGSTLRTRTRPSGQARGGRDQHPEPTRSMAGHRHLESRGPRGRHRRAVQLRSPRPGHASSASPATASPATERLGAAGRAPRDGGPDLWHGPFGRRRVGPGRLVGTLRVAAAPSLVPPADTGEPNDTPDTATPLAASTTVTRLRAPRTMMSTGTRSRRAPGRTA